MHTAFLYLAIEAHNAISVGAVGGQGSWWCVEGIRFCARDVLGLEFSLIFSWINLASVMVVWWLVVSFWSQLEIRRSCLVARIRKLKGCWQWI